MLSRTNTPEARRELGLDGPQDRWARARHAFRLVTAYWRSKEWKLAWTLLILNVALSFYAVDLLVSTTDWERRLFDAMQQHNAAVIPAMLLELAWLVIAALITPVVTGFLIYYLQMRWRLWLTCHYIDRWLAENCYYDIERVRIIDNPDQRITEDTRMIAEQTLAVFNNLLYNLTRAVAYGIVLYGLSVPIRLAFLGYGIAIPGDMVVYGVVASIIGTYAITVIGRPLVLRTMRQQHLDADLRYGLGNIRRYAEQMAFSGAVPFERAALMHVIDNIRRNYQQYIYAMLGLQTGQSLYDRLVKNLPLVTTLPRYFAGAVTMGQFVQTREAFANLVNSLSFIIQAYQGIATQIATFNRLKALDDAIDNPRPRRIALARTDDGSIRADALDIQLPDGSHLLSVPEWHAARGQRWTVTGASGSGKSTLLRALAGLWPDGRGGVALPADGLVMFVPQRLYLPIGQLKDAVTFPATAGDFDDARVLDLFDLCRVGHLADKLHVADVWHDVLSPGEQQRLALVRVLLHRPDYLLMDEATSALDEDNATHLYATLVDRLPDATIVSVTHATALARFHGHSLCIADGVARIVPVDEETIGE